MEAALRSTPDRARTSIWQAPLAPAALTVTFGAVVNRHTSVPLPFSLTLAVVSLLAWLTTIRRPGRGLSLIYLAFAGAAIGSAYYCWYREWFPPDDIGNLASDEPRIIRLRGFVSQEPQIRPGFHDEPLRSMPSMDHTLTVLEATAFRRGEQWLPATGRVRITMNGPCLALAVGDAIEAVGKLSEPAFPLNPGEFDQAARLGDDQIRAVLHVDQPLDSVRIVSKRRAGDWMGWIGVVRTWGRQVLTEHMPPQTAPVAVALLLGDGSAMSGAEWDKYRRTGVMHVLVVSGQHLVVLATFLWLVLRLAMIQRRYAALTIAIVLIAYAALTGGRPPVLRSVVMVCIYCGAIFLCRVPMAINSLALGWLIVFAAKPTDIFDLGCQLSFLSVAVLFWCSRVFEPAERDPLDKLVEESRPTWERCLRWLTKEVLLSYLVTFVVWVAITPLTAAHYHIVSFIPLLVGPPVVLFASGALIGGFLLLFAAALHLPIVALWAFITNASLVACEALVKSSDGLLFAHAYVGDLSRFWLWVFYLVLLSYLLVERLQDHWRWMVSGLGVVVCLGLIASRSRPTPDELRCTFLAVGHGGCTVLETPDGRTLLYDAGAITGPEVTQRQIAPYLWSRGIRRLDEVFLSHADLDHFNGIPALIERFAVGQITCTPSFVDKSAPGVAVTLEAIRSVGVPTRIVKAGDRLQAGDVQIDVLHPPAIGPAGRENFRSMVLHVHYQGKGLLLTGDLEGPGLEQMVGSSLPRTEVLMAPHHGSRAGDAKEIENRRLLIRRSQPRVIVASQGRQLRSSLRPDVYAEVGATYLGTWPHGAVTVCLTPQETVIETYRTGQRLVIVQGENVAKSR